MANAGNNRSEQPPKSDTSASSTTHSLEDVQRFLDWARQYAPEAATLAIGSLALLIVALFALASGFDIGRIALMCGLVLLVGGLGVVVQRWSRGQAPAGFADTMSWVTGLIAMFTIATLSLAVLFPHTFQIGTYLWRPIVDPSLFFEALEPLH